MKKELNENIAHVVVKLGGYEKKLKFTMSALAEIERENGGVAIYAIPQEHFGIDHTSICLTAGLRWANKGIKREHVLALMDAEGPEGLTGWAKAIAEGFKIAMGDKSPEGELGNEADPLPAPPQEVAGPGLGTI